MSRCAIKHFLKDQEICKDNLGHYLLFVMGVGGTVYLFEKNVTFGTNKNEFWLCKNIHAMQLLMS